MPPSANPPHQVGRGVPDVAADADPLSGVVVMHIDGKHLEPIGGTSAAAPLWASLIARLNEGLNARCGFLNPLLYGKTVTGRRPERHHFRQQRRLCGEGGLGGLHRDWHAERNEDAERPFDRRSRCDAEVG